MTAAADTTMRPAATVKAELDAVTKTLRNLETEVDQLYRQAQSTEAERKRLEEERVKVEASALLAGDDTATEDLERRIRELRVAQAEAQEAEAHKAGVLAQIQKRHRQLEVEYMPYERELLIDAHKELRGGLVAAYRELGQLHMRALQAEYRMQSIDRTIGPRHEPYRYQASGSLQYRPTLANPDAAASFYEQGERRGASWEV